MIEVKILSCHSAQRYAVKQRVVAAKNSLLPDHPGLQVIIKELKDWASIEPYTSILSAPSLVINEMMVCVGRCPTRQEVYGWLQSALLK